MSIDHGDGLSDKLTCGAKGVVFNDNPHDSGVHLHLSFDSRLMSFPSKSSATASVMKSSKQHTYKKKKTSMGGEGHVSGSGVCRT